MIEILDGHAIKKVLDNNGKLLHIATESGVAPITVLGHAWNALTKEQQEEDLRVT